MNKLNYIDESTLLLERPNIRENCKIKTDDEMTEYLILYNTYNNLLIQFLMKEFYLENVDEELKKHKITFPKLSSDKKDLYQKSSEGFLEYFYLRNNLYIERLSNKDLDYLFEIYKSGDFSLTEERKKFIERTFLNVIIENCDGPMTNINYGPDSLKFYKPNNAIIIGVRYEQFEQLENNEDALDVFANAEGKLQILMNFLEYKIKREKNIPFYVIKYDDFSINYKKNELNSLK